MRRPGARHPFALWLAAATCSTLGDSVTFFALGWAAAGHGAGAAGLVLTLEGVPLCLLILVGGVVADRVGIRRTMAGCDAAMAVAMAGFALLARDGAPVALLATLGVVSGTASALRRPAELVFPRLFADGEELTRRTATTTMYLQLARIAGPAVAGLLLALGGLGLTSTLDALSFAAVLAALLVVRPPHEPPAAEDGESALARLVAGLRAARATPGAGATVLAVVLLASTVLPLVSMLVPLTARARGWSAHDAGIVTAAWVVGGIAVTAVVARRGAPSAQLALAGPPVAAAGAALLATASTVPVAFVAVLLVGVGTSLFTSRLIPAFFGATPPALLARFSALLGIAQTGPVLLVTPALAATVTWWGVTPAALALGVVLLATAVPAAAAEAEVSPGTAAAR